MPGWTHDPYDAEWETGDGARTVWKPSDDFCEVCESEVDENDECDCEAAE